MRSSGRPEQCGEVAYSTLLLISYLQLIFNPIIYAYMNNGVGGWNYNSCSIITNRGFLSWLSHPVFTSHCVFDYPVAFHHRHHHHDTTTMAVSIYQGVLSNTPPEPKKDAMQIQFEHEQICAGPFFIFSSKLKLTCIVWYWPTIGSH